jgi:uncharacterized protein (DUF927 family)
MTKLIEASKKNPCPICNKEDWCYQLRPSLFCCKRSDETFPGYHRTTKQDRDGAYYFVVNDDLGDWEAKREEWAKQKAQIKSDRIESQQKEFSTQLTSAQRDPLIRSLSQELGLNPEHRKMLSKRGLTDQQIEDSLFFSIEQFQKIGEHYPLNLPGVYLSPQGNRQLKGKGIAIVAIDADGLATGWQVMNDDPRPTDPEVDFSKYYWAKGDKSSHLPIGDGELPIQTIGTAPNPNTSWFCEGLLKPVVASHRIGERFIGAVSGLFRSSPIQVKAALKDVQTVIIAVDAGDVVNPHRCRHWRLETEFFQSLGLEVLFAWWGQINKTENDIDELTLDECSSIEYLTPDRLFAIADSQLPEKEDRLASETAPEKDLDNNNPYVKFSSNYQDGLVLHTVEKQDDGTFQPQQQRIGNHIEAIAYVENTEGAGTGVLVEFRNQRGKTRRVLIPRITLAGDGLEALRFLVDRGYHYSRKQKSLLIDYLFGLGGEVVRVYTIADKTGWVNGSFLTSAKTYGDPDLRFRNPEPDNTLTEIRGSLDGWISGVAAKCHGNSRLLFSIGTSFATPLLEAAQIESGGFHLVGTTSIGKTTAINVAASVAGLKHIPNWRATANALEGKAAESNHMLLPLDEIGQAEPQTVGAAAYMLGNGQGKERMSKILSNVKPKTWLLLFLSTGEVAMVEYLRQAKIPVKGGMEARMPSIPADAGKGFGVFENLHGYQTSKEFVVALESSIRQQQGTALDEYLTQLVEVRKSDDWDKQLRERVHEIASELSQQYSDMVIGRVAERFALIQAGLELAHSFGLLPFPIEECSWAVSQMFTAWVTFRGGAGSIEIKEACNKIKHLFVSSQYGDRIQDSRFPERIVRNLLAYRIGDTVTNNVEYCVPTAIFAKELADGVDKLELIKELHVRKWLKPSIEVDRHTVKRTIEGKRISVFAFREFWNEQISLSDSKKERDARDIRDNNAEISGEEGLQASKDLSRDENLNGTHGTIIWQDANDCPVCPVDQNFVSQQRDTTESLLTNASSSPVPRVPDVPLEKHFAQNTPLPNLLKVGNRVQYIGNNSSSARQYAGILEIHETQGDTYTCKKPDGSLTSWIELDDLQLMEVLL